MTYLNDPLNHRPATFSFDTLNALAKKEEGIYAHGTNLSVVDSALTNTNAQIVPGKVSCEYRVSVSTGESFGLSDLNWNCVSTVKLQIPFFSLTDAQRYANVSTEHEIESSKIRIAANKNCTTIQYNEQILENLSQFKPSNSDKIGVIVMGDKSPSDAKDIPVVSDIKREVAVDRLNIRVVLCKDDHFQEVKNLTSKHPEFGIKVITYTNPVLNNLIAVDKYRDRLNYPSRDAWFKDIPEHERLDTKTNAQINMLYKQNKIDLDQAWQDFKTLII